MGMFSPLPTAIKVRTPKEAAMALKKLASCKLIAVDTETTGLSRPLDRAIIISLSDGKSRWTIWPNVFLYFKDLLEDPERELILHNANFDSWMLRNVGINVNRLSPRRRYRIYDTMIMHALVNDEMAHDLKSLSRYYLGIEMMSFSNTFDLKNNKHLDLKDILLDEANVEKVSHYASLDAFATYKLFVVLKNLLLQTDIDTTTTMWDYYRRYELKFTKILWEMELAGVKIDERKLLDLAPVIEDKILQIEKWFGKKTNNPYLNLNSNPAKHKLFFGILKKEPLEKTASGLPKLDNKVLKLWASQGCEYSEQMLEYSGLTKQLSTYILNLSKRIMPASKRVHTTFKQAGARTGRLSCTAAWTPVKIRSGARGWATMSIEEVRPGDHVWTHKKRWRQVTRVFVKGTEDMYDVRFSNGEVLTCTDLHEVLLSDDVWATIGDLRNEFFKEVGVLPREQRARAGAVQVGGTSDDRGYISGVAHRVSERGVRAEDLHARGGKESLGEGAVLSLEDWQQKSDEGETRRAAPQLEGGVRRRERVSDVPTQWETAVCAPGAVRRAVGDGRIARGASGSPHRQRSEEQQPQQSSDGDESWARKPSLLASEGLDPVTITEINYSGRFEVYDITVEEDASYAACGVFSHNSADPNLQNQAPFIRAAYIPEEGNLIYAADYCVAPSTRILTQDLLWKLASDIVVGEVLIGFGEELKKTKHIPSEVEAVRVLQKPCYKLTMSNGAELICSNDHSWVVGGGGATWKRRNRTWVRTEDIVEGDQIAHFCEPWETLQSREAGYISGILDGEGWVSKSGKVGFAQNPNECLAECERILAKIPSVDFRRRARPQDDVQSMEVYGARAGLRALGIFRPARLLASAGLLWKNKRTWSGCTKKITVVRKEYLGTRDVVAIQTSTKTYIAEGFLSHNCQLEMRILADRSLDPTLCNSVRGGLDTHSATAAVMFHVTYEEIMAAREKDDAKLPLSERERELVKYRKASKTINFGLMYGQGPRKLAATLKIDIDEARGLIKRYFSAMPLITEYFDNAIESARTLGYCTTHLGRRRLVAGLHAYFSSDVSAAERKVKNSPIQGTAADITKCAMIKLYENEVLQNLGVRMLIQVHDEIVFEIPAGLKGMDLFENTVRECMIHPFDHDLAVPLDISAHYGKNWLEAK